MLGGLFYLPDGSKYIFFQLAVFRLGKYSGEYPFQGVAHAQVIVKVDVEFRSEPMDGFSAEKCQTGRTLVTLKDTAVFRIMIFAGRNRVHPGMFPRFAIQPFALLAQPFKSRMIEIEQNVILVPAADRHRQAAVLHLLRREAAIVAEVEG